MEATSSLFGKAHIAQPEACRGLVPPMTSAILDKVQRLIKDGQTLSRFVDNIVRSLRLTSEASMQHRSDTDTNISR